MISPLHGDGGGVGPLAEGLVALEVDGAVFPDGGGAGGGGEGIDVVRLGVDGEEGPLAGAAVHFDAHAGEAELFPLNLDVAAGDEDGLDGGLGGLGVGGGLFGPDDAEVLADGGTVAGAGLEVADEVGEAFEGAGEDVGGGHGRGGQGEGGRGDEGAAGAVLDEADVGGDGMGEGLRGILKHLREPDEAVAIGLAGGDVVVLVTEGGWLAPSGRPAGERTGLADWFGGPARTCVPRSALLPPQAGGWDEVFGEPKKTARQRRALPKPAAFG